jgi:hypothetical protein
LRVLPCFNAVLAAALCAAAQAKDVQPVLSFEVISRSSAFGGVTFGDHGPYEQIRAIARLQVDPKARANRAIVDLDRAPRDANGLVHYDVDVEILRPLHAAGARRVLIYDVVNRGSKTIQGLNGVSLAHADDAGDGFLMRQGYTIVRSGWQGDVTRPGLIAARFPIASDRGQPITGPVAEETVFDDLTTTRVTLTYPAATLSQTTAALTVREHAEDPAQVVAPNHWRYQDNEHVSLDRPANMDAGAIYRFSYIARDPVVMGLGFAATRDLMGFLRHASADATGAPNPLADIASANCERNARGDCANAGGGVFDTAVAYGGSQSARYLRDWVWQGFNRDLAGRRVFDGVIAFIPGARRTFTNMRFSEPGRFSRQHEDHDVPGFDFPFTYITMRDKVTGHSDGILRRCSADGTCPKIFHIDTSAEFWQAGASLIGTGGVDTDVPLPADVRAYMIAGGAHATGLSGPMCTYPANTLNYTPVLRALLVDMIDWTTQRSDPPESRWPKVADGVLVSAQALRAPDLSSRGVSWPKVVNRPVPPSGRHGWQVLVPSVDADGNDIAGIRMPQLASPTATYLGWNVRRAGFAEGELCLVYGSLIPFASDAMSRGTDPRPSIAEREAGSSDPRASFEQAVERLRRDRLLLDEDAARMRRGAEPEPDIRR